MIQQNIEMFFILSFFENCSLVELPQQIPQMGLLKQINNNKNVSFQPLKLEV